MTPKEYFGRWWNCIDEQVLNNTMIQVRSTYKTDTVYPHLKDVFKAFELCPYNDLKVVIIGQDPYPQAEVATGLAFANKEDTEQLSPSLQVLFDTLYSGLDQPCVINPNLEHWAKQGVLLLNSSLTVVQNNPSSHTMLWRNFMTSFIKGLCEWHIGIVFVLLGDTAKTFDPYIGPFNDVLIYKHPAYYARTGERMPDFFTEVNKLIKKKNNMIIDWYGKQED